MFKLPIRILIAVSAAAVVAGPSAGAEPASNPNNQPALHDCIVHNEITRQFSLAVLRDAERRMPDDVRIYSWCRISVRSAIAALTGRAGHNTPHAVVRDCAGDGDLDRHYSMKGLHRALRNLPGDVDMYTPCRKAIDSQINTLAARP